MLSANLLNYLKMGGSMILLKIKGTILLGIVIFILLLFAACAHTIDEAVQQKGNNESIVSSDNKQQSNNGQNEKPATYTLTVNSKPPRFVPWREEIRTRFNEDPHADDNITENYYFFTGDDKTKRGWYKDKYLTRRVKEIGEGFVPDEKRMAVIIHSHGDVGFVKERKTFGFQLDGFVSKSVFDEYGVGYFNRDIETCLIDGKKLSLDSPLGVDDACYGMTGRTLEGKYLTSDIEVFPAYKRMDDFEQFIDGLIKSDYQYKASQSTYVLPDGGVETFYGYSISDEYRLEGKINPVLKKVLDATSTCWKKEFAETYADYECYAQYIFKYGEVEEQDLYPIFMKEDSKGNKVKYSITLWYETADKTTESFRLGTLEPGAKMDLTALVYDNLDHNNQEKFNIGQGGEYYKSVDGEIGYALSYDRMKKVEDRRIRDLLKTKGLIMPNCDIKIRFTNEPVKVGFSRRVLRPGERMLKKLWNIYDE